MSLNVGYKVTEKKPTITKLYVIDSWSKDNRKNPQSQSYISSKVGQKITEKKSGITKLFFIESKSKYYREEIHSSKAICHRK